MYYLQASAILISPVIMIDRDMTHCGGGLLRDKNNVFDQYNFLGLSLFLSLFFCSLCITHYVEQQR